MKTFIFGLVFLLLGEYCFAQMPGSGWGVLTLIPCGCVALFIAALILLIRHWKSGIVFLLSLVSLWFYIWYSLPSVFLMQCLFTLLLYVLFYFYKNIKFTLASLVIVCVSLLFSLKNAYEHYLSRIASSIFNQVLDVADYCSNPQRIGYSDWVYHDNLKLELKKCFVNDTEVVIGGIHRFLCRYMVRIAQIGQSDAWDIEISNIILNDGAFVKENCQAENKMHFYLKTKNKTTYKDNELEQERERKKTEKSRARKRRVAQREKELVSLTGKQRLSYSVECDKQEDCSKLGKGWYCNEHYGTISYCMEAKTKEKEVNGKKYFYSSLEDEFNFYGIRSLQAGSVIAPGCFWGNFFLSYKGAVNYCESIGKTLVDPSLLLNNCEPFQFLLEDREFFNFWTKDGVSVEIDSENGIKCSIYQYEGRDCNNGGVICQ